MDRFQCRYYEEDKYGSDAYMMCMSPKRDSQRHTKDITVRNNGCFSADENGCRLSCPFFVAPQGAVPDPSPASSNGGAGGGNRFAFVPDKGMCQYWRKCEIDRKKYHCTSPGNAMGAEYEFDTLGPSDGARRYSRQCRRCNAAGEPPQCELFPGPVTDVNVQNANQSSVLGEVAKVAVSAALSPAGTIAGKVADAAVSSVIDKL